MRQKNIKRVVCFVIAMMFFFNISGFNWIVPQVLAQEAEIAPQASEESAVQETSQDASAQSAENSLSNDEGAGASRRFLDTTEEVGTPTELKRASGQGDEEGLDVQSEPPRPGDSGMNLPKNILGGFQVDQFTGSAVMSYPIEVPPGRGGLQPFINLVYNSSNRDGWLGIGWDLNLGYIQRSTKKGVPKYDSTDEFVFVGPTGSIELVPIGNGEYRAKTEQAFMKFSTDGDNWYAWDKNGTKYEFGEIKGETDGEVLGPFEDWTFDHVFRWQLTKIMDVHNNEIKIYYRGLSGNKETYLVPYQIYYNYNLSNPQAKTILIRFNHNFSEERTDVEETIDNSSGSPRSYAARLKDISIYEYSYPSQLIRRYDFSYIYGADSTRSLLSQITQYGSDGVTALPPTKFTYQTNDNLYNFVRDDAGEGEYSNLDDYKIYPGDYNGDGKTDFVAFRGGGGDYDEHMKFFLSHGTSFREMWSKDDQITNWNFFYTDQFYPGDYNGDGRTDLFAYSDLGNRVGLITFSQNDPYEPTASAVTGTISGDGGSWDLAAEDTSYQFYPGDYDGDGKTELFVLRIDPSYLSYLYSVGYLDFDDNSFDFKWSQPFIWVTSWQYFLMFPFYPGDYNGDRKTDIALYFYNYQSQGESLRLYLSNGDSFTEVWRVDGSMNGWDFYSGDWFAPGDYNGDGRTDLFSVSREFGGHGSGGLFLSNGTGFDVVWASHSFDPGSDHPWDIDGLDETYFSNDFRAIGKSDIFAIDSGGATDVALAKYTKDNFDAFDILFYMDRLGENTTSLNPGDYNGDGLTEFLIKHNGDAQLEFLLPEDAVIPDILSTIENGIGGTIDIGYSPSSNYANQLLPLVKQVVSSVTTSDARNPSVKTNYSYSGGLFDAEDREFRGFKTCKVINQEGNVVETEYSQEKPFIGKPLTVMLMDNDTNRNLYRKVKNTWSSQDLFGDQSSIFPFLSSSITHLYNGGGTEYLSSKTVPTYDSLGNLTKSEEWVDSNGGEDFSLHRFTETEYQNDTGQWILGRPTRTVLKDSAGNTKRESWMTYTSRGQVKSVTSWLDTGDDPVITYNYDYDDADPNNGTYGHQTEAIDALGNKSTTTYEAATDFIFPTKVTNALGHAVTYSYDMRMGTLNFITDPNGNKIEYQYDTLGRLIKVIKPGDSVTYPTLEYSYDDFGNVNTQRVTTYQRVYPGEDKVFSAASYFDGLGRAYKMKRPLKKEGNTLYSIIQETEFDWKGRPVKTSLPYLDYGGTAIREETQYDLLDRPTAVIHADGTRQTISYSGTTVTNTDENNHQRKESYDPFGNLVQVDEYLDARTLSTTYNYDVLGQLLEMRDVQQNLWQYSYDSLGQMRSSLDPDRGFWQFTSYDANGNLKEKIDARGTLQRYDYDVLGRPVRLFLNQSPEPEEQYIYDISEQGIGKLARVEFNRTTPFQGSVSFTYDERGRILTKTQTTDGLTHTVRFTYTSHDAPRTIVYPNNDTLSYVYGFHKKDFSSFESNFGLVYGISNYISWIEYTPSLQKARIDFVNGISTTYSYDTNRLWPRQLKTSKASTDLQNWSYGYDNTGNVTSITDNIPSSNKSQGFGYDALNRLTSANGPYGNLSYSYDDLGNIRSKENVTFNYPDPLSPRPHAVTSTSTGKTFSYDANGNLTSASGTILNYDGLNHLTSVLGPKDASLFLYDYAGSRIRKAVIDISCSCLCGNEFPGADPVQLEENAYAYTIYFGKIFEQDKITGKTKSYILLNNQRIAFKDHEGNRFFYYPNHLGGTEIVTDINGTPAQTAFYKPFGETYEETGSGLNHFKYSGEEFDSEQGLYYFGARYYDPEIGKFITTDPILGSGSSQSMNPYSYVANNPLTNVDPRGECFDPFTAVICGAIAAGASAVASGAAALWVALPAVVQSSIVTNVTFYTIATAPEGKWTLGGFLNAGMWGAVSGAASWGLSQISNYLATEVYKHGWIGELGARATVNLGYGLLISGGSHDTAWAGTVLFDTAVSYGAGNFLDFLAGGIVGSRVGQSINSAIENNPGHPVVWTMNFFTQKSLGGDVMRAAAFGYAARVARGVNPSAIADKFNNFNWWTEQMSQNKPGIVGTFDVQHFSLGAVAGKIFKSMGYDSASASSLTSSYLFWGFEGFVEPTNPWEQGDYYSDVAGALAGY